MNLFPFLLLGLVNGSVVGLIVALVARAMSPGSESVRFRDAAFFGMLGSIGGSAIATVVSAQDGYLASGPSSLLFSVVGAAVAIGGVSFRQLTRRAPQASESFGARES